MIRFKFFLIRFIIILLVFIFPKHVFSFENSQFAKVGKIYDGDTIELKLKEPTPIRLTGIDCFETSNINRTYKQAYLYNISIEEVIKRGILAKKELTKIISKNGYKIYFKCDGIDKYGRLLGQIYTLNGQNINDIMKKSKYCYPFKY